MPRIVLLPSHFVTLVRQSLSLLQMSASTSISLLCISLHLSVASSSALKVTSVPLALFKKVLEWVHIVFRVSWQPVGLSG